MPSNAHAQKSNEDRAFALYQKARDSFEKSDYKTSVKFLKEAWRLYGHPVIGIKLADVYEKLDKPEEALVALTSIETNDPEITAKIKVRVKALRNYLEQPLSVSVISNIPNTTVTIDHMTRRSTPFDVRLSRGVHILTASAKGHREQQEVVRVRGSKPLLIRFTLHPVTGTVTVRTDRDTLRDTSILLDGVRWNLSVDEKHQSETRPRTVQVGKHQFACWNQGQTKDIRFFEVREGEDVVLDCNSRPVDAGASTRTWGYVSMGTGIVSILGGAGLFFSYYQDLKKAERDDLIMETNKHIFGGVFLATGVGLGVLSYFLFKSAKKEASPTGITLMQRERFDLELVPSPGILGAGARLSF